jgi:hypothetical protein
MGPKIDPSVERAVKTLSKAGFTGKDIQNQLNEGENRPRLSTIYDIIHNKGKRRVSIQKTGASPKNVYPCKKKTPALLRKINALTNKENPPSQNVMAKKLGISQGYVNRIIRKDLGKIVRRKVKVHRLKESHKKNRKTNCRKLYEGHLAGTRSEFVVTLDEALFFVQDCDGTRKICYTKDRKEAHKYVYQKHEKFSDKLMVVGAMTGRGVIPLIPVRTNAKVNSKYYVDNVLKKILEEEVPRLYPGELEKVFLHHDAASSHTAKFTQQYGATLSATTGMKIISNEEIPVKSPDASPMDFYGFGYLKQRLKHRRATTLAGLWKVLNEEWNNVNPQMCTKVFDNWKRRLRLVSKRSGEHIECVRTIHKRRV